MKKNNTTTIETNENVTTETTVTNPFEALTATTTTEKSSRKLQFTGVLQDRARSMTIDLVKRSAGHETLAPLAQKMLADKTPESLMQFINAGISAEDITTASSVLDGCPSDDLPKMLESQRSNRSKAKRTGLTAMPKVVDYISAMVGELLIRERTGKAYNAGGGSLETDHEKLAADQETLVKRINSLASKKSRLSKLAQYDANAKTELEDVERELSELRALRPGKTRTTVKSTSIDDIKSALAAGSLDAESLKTLLEAMASAQNDETVAG